MPDPDRSEEEMSSREIYLKEEHASLFGMQEGERDETLLPPSPFFKDLERMWEEWNEYGGEG